MKNIEIKTLLEKQRLFYRSGKTLSVEFRMKQLKKLYQKIVALENEIQTALYCDLGKSAFEGFMSEIGMVLSEISYMLRHTAKWSAPQKVSTPLAQFPSHSFKQPIPYGNTLIMSPWNYPFLLTISPLVNAIAAGNTVILKPSAYSPATSEVVSKIIRECFPPKYIAVVTGGREENTALLRQKFDFIFFTGSQEVGKEVLRQAAEHLTPVVLELGGKSPCIVDESADISLAARRIVFGKFLNCGQTCVAPDHILCHSSIHDKLVTELKKEITRQYGKSPLSNNHYGKIINSKHFLRLTSLIDQNKLVSGGESNPQSLQIAPTILDNVNFDDSIMQEEIFGPILPILTYENFDELLQHQKVMPKPLALYFFSTHKGRIARILKELSYGGGCINDVIIHLATSEMGFGGVGESGMGSYHGKAGFEAFSHYKSIVHKKNWLDLPIRYQPYQPLFEKLLRLFLK